MPLYEYRCDACGDIIEIMQKFTDSAPTTCEKCGKGPMEKLMSKTSFALKGTGWYVTDFKGGSTPDKGASGSQTEGSAKSDSKPEAPAETKSAASPGPAPAATGSGSGSGSGGSGT